jgi:hypothetical protein
MARRGPRNSAFAREEAEEEAEAALGPAGGVCACMSELRVGVVTY